MFIHLGGDVMVLKKDIIAILDTKTKQASSTREFLAVARDEGFVKNISSEEKEKTFIITNKEVYLSPISCNTLKKRSQNVIFLSSER
ncbi:hypothetical protein JOC37_002254 [Desulfohalotomaculum tongense]|uniref:extracellular matrix regulator RemB n=1 Tax=Desulforadius tongensis TaxID=1216062 RepID=UPI001958424F|nr:DUF370 domain-containing protein [Desulforadius tongensis]MBM7855834.1 hypothetical protein [Desulforadius tongensis]